MSVEHGKIENGIGKRGIAVAVAMLLGACSTAPTVVQSVQPGDPQLSCDQLVAQHAEAEKLRLEAEGRSGTSGGNIVHAFLFLPGFLVNKQNVTDAVNAAEARKTHLSALISQKKCPAPKKPAAAKPGAK
jgi:hypothetical protein